MVSWTNDIITALSMCVTQLRFHNVESGSLITMEMIKSSMLLSCAKAVFLRNGNSGMSVSLVNTEFRMASSCWLSVQHNKSMIQFHQNYTVLEISYVGICYIHFAMIYILFNSLSIAYTFPKRNTRRVVMFVRQLIFNFCCLFPASTLYITGIIILHTYP